MNFVPGPIQQQKETKPDFFGAFILCCLAVFSYGLVSFGQDAEETYLANYRDSLDGLYPMSRTISRQLQRDFDASDSGFVGAHENLIWFWAEDRVTKRKDNVVYFFPTETSHESGCDHCENKAYYTRAVLPSLPGQAGPLTKEQVQKLVESSQCFQHAATVPHRFGLPKELSPDYQTQKNVHYRLASVQRVGEQVTVRLHLSAGTSTFRDDSRELYPNIKQLTATIELPGGVDVQESL